MRTQLLIRIVTLSLVASAGAAAATPAATPVSSSHAAESGPAATWTPRKLLNFGGPLFLLTHGNPDFGCDELVGELRFVLIQLGARESDLHIDQRGCRPESGVDATFSVLAPADKTGTNGADAVAEARWQTVELRTGMVASGKLLAFRDTPTSQLEG